MVGEKQWVIMEAGNKEGGSKQKQWIVVSADRSYVLEAFFFLAKEFYFII